MMDRFEELLKALGQLLNVPLHPDHKGKCRLNVNNLFHIQLDPDPAKNRLLIATFVCPVPPGKARENILKNALKTNGAPSSLGTLAYSERTHQLALFSYLPFYELTGEKLAAFLAAFIQKADEWRMGVETGNLSS